MFIALLSVSLTYFFSCFLQPTYTTPLFSMEYLTNFFVVQYVFMFGCGFVDCVEVVLAIFSESVGI